MFNFSWVFPSWWKWTVMSSEIFAYYVFCLNWIPYYIVFDLLYQINLLAKDCWSPYRIKKGFSISWYIKIAICEDRQYYKRNKCIELILSKSRKKRNRFAKDTGRFYNRSFSLCVHYRLWEALCGKRSGNILLEDWIWISGLS